MKYAVPLILFVSVLWLSAAPALAEGCGCVEVIGADPSMKVLNLNIKHGHKISKGGTLATICQDDGLEYGVNFTIDIMWDGESESECVQIDVHNPLCLLKGSRPSAGQHSSGLCKARLDIKTASSSFGDNSPAKVYLFPK